MQLLKEMEVKTMTCGQIFEDVMEVEERRDVDICCKRGGKG